MKRTTIRGVFFDLDGTLYDRDTAIVRLAEAQFHAFSLELKAIGKDRYVERVLELDNHGHDRTARFHYVVAESFGLSSELGDRLEEFFRQRYPGYCNLPEDSLQTLATLRERGFKLGVITNGPTFWQGLKIENMGLPKHVDTILISEREGIGKPDPRIFVRAAERCGVEPSESMFVGDNPKADIEGARSAGFLPVWKRTKYWNAADDVARIDNLSELLSMLDSTGGAVPI